MHDPNCGCIGIGVESNLDTTASHLKLCAVVAVAVPTWPVGLVTAPAPSRPATRPGSHNSQPNATIPVMREKVTPRVDRFATKTTEARITMAVMINYVKDDEYNYQRQATTQTVGSMERAGVYLPAAVRGMSRRATVGPAARDSVAVVCPTQRLRAL